MLNLANHKYQQSIYSKVVLSCQHILSSSNNSAVKDVRKYIDFRMTKYQQMNWKIGCFPNDDNIEEILSLVTKDELKYLNLYYPKFLSGGKCKHSHFSEHNLVFPFYNDHNEIIGLVGRCVLTEEERRNKLLNKYKYSSNCKKELFSFGLNKAKEHILKKDCVICVEGQFDCMSLNDKGIYNVVAMGWANISKFQLFQLNRYTENIILLFDNDEAGIKGKDKVRKNFKAYANIKTVLPPENYKDIDEFLMNCNDKKYIEYVIDMIKGFGE